MYIQYCIPIKYNTQTVCIYVVRKCKLLVNFLFLFENKFDLKIFVQVSK